MSSASGQPASPTRPAAAQAPVLQVNLNSPVPPYEQLREQIAGLIATNDLKPGDRLPPVRQLAADLGLAGGTVARAYRELEQAGLIEGRGRHGTVVRDAAADSVQDESRRQQLTAAAAHLAKTARELGFSDEAALAAARGALARAAAAG
jgi:DNA-binding transcriptional regulator YhcF (GntR family)